MASDSKGNKNPGIQKLREIITPRKSEQPLVEKGVRGVTVDNIDRDNPPIRMQPKSGDTNPGTTTGASPNATKPDSGAATNANPNATKPDSGAATNANPNATKAENG